MPCVWRCGESGDTCSGRQFRVRAAEAIGNLTTLTIFRLPGILWSDRYRKSYERRQPQDGGWQCFGLLGNIAGSVRRRFDFHNQV